MSRDSFWQTKLHARLHDPAEKALVLLRDPEGHEGGTSRALHRDLGFNQLSVNDWLDPDNPEVLDGVLFKKGIPVTMYKSVKHADWWAAAADRPQWPHEEVQVDRKGDRRTIRNAPWAQVRWFDTPELIHPLTGHSLDLKTLFDTDLSDLKKRSLDHFTALKISDSQNDSDVDWEKTLLAYWRFGPELKEDREHNRLGLLWPLLPADTRVPDHSIWDHLDLTSAFAGAFARDSLNRQRASLLSLSIGPVQGFIEAARTPSDLWAGSHLLSRLSWEAMKVICEELGPDAVLFPRLRGLPQVDLWLREKGLPESWFAKCRWMKNNTDTNPLFAAALPNRLVAIVPEEEAKDLSQKIVCSVRKWLHDKGELVVQRLLEAAGMPMDPNLYCFAQMREQLDGFPEIHWATVPFSLIGVRNPERSTGLDTTNLENAMAPFFHAEEDIQNAPGFLGSAAWKVLREDGCEGSRAFFSSNPGALYPAVHELCERVLSAAKSVRPFKQTKQTGWRCSLTGETEWLTSNPEQLLRSYRQSTDTLWDRVAKRKPSWVKKGEHLGALAAIKRLWPVLFTEEVKEATGKQLDRFVVSTHTMALAGSLEELDRQLFKNPDVLKGFINEDDQAPALPPKLAKLRRSDAARVPGVLDRLRKNEESDVELDKFENQLKELLDHKPDVYYALLLFDGDHMGKILSGQHCGCRITFRNSFHRQVRSGFDNLARNNPRIKKYGEMFRPVSPNRHLAISASLNDFALHAVPEVVEREHCGRVIYAGGDDVLAMLPVVDLIPVMRRLRKIYSGEGDHNELSDWQSVDVGDRLICKNGYALLPDSHGPHRLLRMMGAGASASCGAVIAHHQAPLALVLRELRNAEKRAKDEGGRDAFSLKVLKRSGGDLWFTWKWGKHGEHIEMLDRFRRFLADPSVSRRAVYNSLVWLRDLPDQTDPDMLNNLLFYQLKRQTENGQTVIDHDLRGLSEFAGQFAKDATSDWRQRLENFLCVSEFLARETRSPGAAENSDRGPKSDPENGVSDASSRMGK